jgi:hypothetical protein
MTDEGQYELGVKQIGSRDRQLSLSVDVSGASLNFESGMKGAIFKSV